MTGVAKFRGRAGWMAGMVMLALCGAVLAVDAPHLPDVMTTDDAVCGQCHILHAAVGGSLTNVSGNANLCQQCHSSNGAAKNLALLNGDQAVLGLSGSSHRWDATAVSSIVNTVLPSNTDMRTRIVDGKIMCSTCHDQHTQSNGWPFLRVSNTDDAMCVQCHAKKATADGSHPTNAAIPGTGYYQNPPNLPLVNGKASCTSCHSMHFAYSGTSSVGTAASGSTVTMLNTSTTTYATNALVNWKVYFTNGGNAGQVRTIASNTPSSMSWASSLDGAPAVGAAYRVQDATNYVADSQKPGDGFLLKQKSTAMCTECHTLPTATAVHFQSDIGALWPGGSQTGYGSTYPSLFNGNLVPPGTPGASSGQPLPVAYRGQCLSCHAPHGQPDDANPSVMYPKVLVERMDVKDDRTDPDDAEDLCYSCHNGTTRANGLYANEDMKTVFNRSSRHPVKDSEQLPGRSVECRDCHDVHVLQSLTVAYTASSTSAAATTFITSGLTANALIGQDILFTNGTNNSQQRTVVSNTTTTITFAPAISTASRSGDTARVQITNHVWGTSTAGRALYGAIGVKAQAWPTVGTATFSAPNTTDVIDQSRTWTVNSLTGQTAVIITGTNAGQQKTIASNTATAIRTAGFSSAIATGTQYEIYASAPTNYNWTPVTITGASNDYEAYVCFKCHSSYSGTTLFGSLPAPATSTRTFYLTNTAAASPMPVAQQSSDAPFQSGTWSALTMTVAATTGAGATYAVSPIVSTINRYYYGKSWLSPALSAQSIPAGTWSFTLNGWQSTANVNGHFRARVYVWNSGNIKGADIYAPSAPDTHAALPVSASAPATWTFATLSATTLSASDRLAVDVWFESQTASSAGTITIGYNGASPNAGMLSAPSRVGINATPTMVSTDTGREFNPNIQRYHKVASTTDKTSTYTGTYVAPWTRTTQMTCSDCHTSDQLGVAVNEPNGPHGSNQSFILRGVWSAAATRSTTNLVCNKCHNVSNSGGFSGSDGNLHTNHHGSVACAACHGVVPHGWPHSKPVWVSTDPAPYNTAAVTAGFRMNTSGWTRAAGSYQQGDCVGSSCGH